LLVNGRSFAGASLQVGILKSYKEFFKRVFFGFEIDEQQTMKLMKSFVQVFYRNVREGVAQAVDALLSRALAKVPFKLEGADKENLSLAFGTFIDHVIESREVSDDSAVALQSFVDLAIARRKRPVLIIDEADKVLGLGEGQGATSSVLSQIVMLTKQSMELDVIMASSEYAYPYLLEDCGLNLNDISAILFAGEIPPKSTWELLVTKKKENGNINQPAIGMGKNLAYLLIASYGGHFLRMSSAPFFLDNKETIFHDCYGSESNFQ
jgi:hypothetical protein